MRCEYVHASFDGINRFHVSASHSDWISQLDHPMNHLDGWELDRYLLRIEQLEDAISRHGGERLYRLLGRLPSLAAGTVYLTSRLAHVATSVRHARRRLGAYSP